MANNPFAPYAGLQNTAGTSPWQGQTVIPSGLGTIVGSQPESTNWPQPDVYCVPTLKPADPKLAILSDSDILLMATCIEHDHPSMEGRNYCFCAAKRIEKGISKE